MTSYASFFGGAATVAGALVGLLFVALSVSPERLRGDTASLEHQAIAATAFTALVDALFVSLIGLQPGGGLRYGAVILGGIGLTSSCGLVARLWQARRIQELSRRWPYLLSFIIVIYAAQVVTGLIPLTGSGEASLSTTFVYTMFAVGISRSWELLGLRGGGPLDLLTQRLETRRPAAEQPSTDTRLRGERTSRGHNCGEGKLTMAACCGPGAELTITGGAHAVDPACRYRPARDPDR